ncbi:MAG: MlaD family protein [Sulfurimonas sp.]|uniref:MlaD family protein n=1 Tax=Sulfurimonas sp. TaxID=2022749 RepID=UPI00260AE7E5|nr:MlaD family protein [Sulfurimonas sp.]MDD2652670.1 MlaD family protein [Sulfurimonas sp.]MDD3450837.1 MlaD family protein [Sulfurimonas sp.]
MNNRVNYSLIGFLMLFAISLMLGFGYWLLKPAKEIEMRTYAIYFEESVLGLNLDAAVKYRGISVGKVTQLSINPKNSQEVMVLVSILKSTPIKSSTRAQLTSQGITGLSYINLSFSDDSAEELKRTKGEDYPVIKTIPSLLIKIENSLGDITLQLSETLKNFNVLLRDKNQEEVTLLLKNSALFVSKLNSLLDDKTAESLKQTIKNLENSSAKLDAMMPRIAKLIDNSIVWEDRIAGSFASIMQSYIGIRGAMDTINNAVKSGDFNFKEMTSELLPTMNNTLLEMQTLMIKIEETLKKYERSPSDILFLQEQMKKGPGEK